jgi:hypothetical protein
MNQLLFRIGRWLVLRAYVPGEKDATLIHDLQRQVQELRRENQALKLQAIVNKVKHSH